MEKRGDKVLDVQGNLIRRYWVSDERWNRMSRSRRSVERTLGGQFSLVRGWGFSWRWR